MVEALALDPGGRVGEPDASITISTLDLCRIAARRLAIDDATFTVVGDRALVEPVLVGAQAFAAD